MHRTVSLERSLSSSTTSPNCLKIASPRLAHSRAHAPQLRVFQSAHGDDPNCKLREFALLVTRALQTPPRNALTVQLRELQLAHWNCPKHSVVRKHSANVRLLRGFALLIVFKIRSGFGSNRLSGTIPSFASNGFLERMYVLSFSVRSNLTIPFRNLDNNLLIGTLPEVPLSIVQMYLLFVQFARTHDIHADRSRSINSLERSPITIDLSSPSCNAHTRARTHNAQC